MNIEERQQKLNDLMTEHSRLKGDSGNDALCSTLREQALTILLSNFESLVHVASGYFKGRGTREDCEDAVQTALLEAFEKYDSQRNDNFCAYFYTHLRYVVMNVLGKEYIDTQPKKKGSSSDESTEKTGRYEKRGQSLDSSIASKNEPSYPPIIDPTPTPDEQVGNRMTLEEYYTRLAVCVVRISPSKYNRAFATEQYIMLCREHLNRILDINENEAFNHVMNIDFADYTLDGICRSFYEIEITPCKLYSEFGLKPIGQTEKSKKWAGRLCVPFENRIFANFFEVTDGAIVQQRTNFRRKMGITSNEGR